MFFFYNIISFFFLLFSPIFISIRLIIKKEDPRRFLEKFCIYSKKTVDKTIWFHGASVGEVMTILPIIRELEKNKKIKKILITTSTVSSSQIISKQGFKKVTHLYYPFDINLLCKKFIKNWKPKIAIYVDSEIWPNMYNNLEKQKIPILLINGRITKKTFKRWSKFPNFAQKVFGKITLALPQNNESNIYLRKLGTKKIKNAGNLKYYKNESSINKSRINLKIKNKLVFCAASTHYNEENIIGKLHLELKKKFKNLLTILIPRHINRSEQILRELNNLKLNVVTRSSKKNIGKNCDIFLVDTYGELTKFFQFSKIAFVGGSLIPHGGQNPLEPARLGNYVMYGKEISNFKEIYKLLDSLNLATKIKHLNDMKKIFYKNYNFKKSEIKIKKINLLGKKIFNNNMKEINNLLNENK